MKIKLLILVIISCTLNVFSQDKQEKREQIKALKVSFLTTELNLSSNESEKFWPIYNAFENKQHDIRHNKVRMLMKKIDAEGTDKLSEKQANAYINQFVDADAELFNLRKKLVADLKTVIGPVKIIKLKKAEEDFNKKLLHKYKDNKK